MVAKTLETPQVVGRVSHIAFYPVKSARMIEVKQAVITPEGIEGDRQFMIVKKVPDKDGVYNFVTQRRGIEEKERRAEGFPTVALIRPELHNGILRLTWESKDPIDLPININSGKELAVGIWGKVVNAVDQGDKSANWISEHLGTEVRFVKAAGSFARTVSQQWMENNNTVRFQDGYPIHWFTQESVNELSQIVGEEISWRRFRPNFVTEGGNSQMEHLVYKGEIAGIPFLHPKPCDRCPTTTVDQETAEVHKLAEPLRSLAKYMRWDKRGEQKVIFGENALPLKTGEVKVGDEVTMIAIRDPPLVYGSKV